MTYDLTHIHNEMITTIGLVTIHVSYTYMKAMGLVNVHVSYPYMKETEKYLHVFRCPENS